MASPAPARPEGNDTTWAIALCVALLGLIALLAASPDDVPCILLPIFAAPVARAIAVPPLGALSRRLAEPNIGRVAALVLDEAAMRVAYTCCWLIALAGAVALVLLGGASALNGFPPGGIAGKAAVSNWPSPSGLGPLSGLGIAAGIAALALPRPWLAGLDAADCVFVLGAGLLLALVPPLDHIAGLSTAAALMPAQILPSLLAVIALPWLRGPAVLMGVAIGGPVSLVATGSGAFDGPSAALVGLIVNLAVAVMFSGPALAPQSAARARMQSTLPQAPLNRPIVWTGGVLWVFLALGPGWPLLRDALGGPWTAGLAAAVTACSGLLWLRLRVLPEKCEAVFRKEARQTKELGC